MLDVKRGDAQQPEPTQAEAKRSWTPPPLPPALRGGERGAGATAVLKREEQEAAEPGPSEGQGAAEARVAGGEAATGPDQLRRELERMLEAVAKMEGTEGAAGTPIVFGHALSGDGQGGWRVQRFGNVQGQGEGRFGTGPWMPYTVILLDKATSSLTLRADLPGVPKREVHLNVKEKELSVEAAGPDRSYRMRIALPRQVVADEGNARMEDGVLHVTLPLAKVLPPGGVQLAVE